MYVLLSADSRFDRQLSSGIRVQEHTCMGGEPGSRGSGGGDSRAAGSAAAPGPGALALTIGDSQSASDVAAADACITDAVILRLL